MASKIWFHYQYQHFESKRKISSSTPILHITFSVSYIFPAAFYREMDTHFCLGTLLSLLRMRETSLRCSSLFYDGSGSYLLTVFDHICSTLLRVTLHTFLITSTLFFWGPNNHQYKWKNRAFVEVNLVHSYFLPLFSLYAKPTWQAIFISLATFSSFLNPVLPTLIVHFMVKIECKSKFKEFYYFFFNWAAT